MERDGDSIKEAVDRVMRSDLGRLGCKLEEGRGIFEHESFRNESFSNENEKCPLRVSLKM